MLRALALALVPLAGACQTVATQAPPPRRNLVEPERTGLFPADARVLPDEDIARILDASWRVPERVRIALLPLRHESVFGTWATPATATALQTPDRAVEELRRLPFVHDVSFLPDFLLPRERSIALVREAAARYQADWVLVYSTTLSAHPDYRVFARDQVHGQCLVECALLDTRSGLIPFTARSTREVHVKQRGSEEMPALLLRAEHEAVDAAMLENARALVAFLEPRG